MNRVMIWWVAKGKKIRLFKKIGKLFVVFMLKKDKKEKMGFFSKLQNLINVLKIKNFASVIKLHWIMLVLLLAHFFLAVLWFNGDLVDYFLFQILNFGSKEFNSYWGERGWFIFLKYLLKSFSGIIRSFSILFFVLYRYFKKNTEMQKKYINILVFDLWALLYGFIYFNFIILGTVTWFQFNLEYKILGLLSTQWLESYTYFASYQTVFGIMSVNTFFILFFLLLNSLLVKIMVNLIDKYLI